MIGSVKGLVLSPRCGLLVGVAAACAAALVSFAPAAVAAAVGIAALPFLPRSALARTGFLVVGGLMTLQSGVDRLTADKVVYLTGVACASAMAAISLYRRRGDRGFEPMRILWPLFAGFSVMCVVSAPVAWVNNVSPSDWLRDASSYALIALVPLFVSDLAAEVSDWRVIAGLFVPLAGMSTVSFALEFLHRRRVLDFDASFGLPSFLLPAALFAVVVSAAVLAHARAVRVASLAVALGVFGFLIGTGTRTTVLLLAAILPPLVRLRKRPGISYRRALVTTLGAIIAAAGLVAAVASFADGRISDRLKDIPKTIAAPTSDQSYRLRADAWRSAWDEFEGHPALGVGAGFRFTWSISNGRTSISRTAYNVDSPLGFPAKFGILGLFLVGLSVLATARFVCVTLPMASPIAWSALAGFGCVVLAFVLFGVPMEDKGVAFGLLGLMAMVAVSAARSPRAAERLP